MIRLATAFPDGLARQRYFRFDGGGVRRPRKARRGWPRLLARCRRNPLSLRCRVGLDFASSFSSSYTNLRDDYRVRGPRVCAGALNLGTAAVPAWQQALAALVLTHDPSIPAVKGGSAMGVPSLVLGSRPGSSWR
jgi:hypothetical protein